MIEEAMMANIELIDMNQEMKDSNWLYAMKEELKEIEENRAWELVNESNKKEVDVKWIYKLNY
jgi:hypothetical protein